MESNIKPTTKLKEGEKYTLIDKDFLLIEAIRNLTIEIQKLRGTLK